MDAVTGDEGWDFVRVAGNVFEIGGGAVPIEGAAFEDFVLVIDEWNLEFLDELANGFGEIVHGCNVTCEHGWSGEDWNCAVSQTCFDDFAGCFGVGFGGELSGVVAAEHNDRGFWVLVF